METRAGIWIVRQKAGVTLVELMVSLAIVGILAAIAVPNLTAYVHHAQFQRNEAYARTLYLDAEANLTHLRAAGLWEDFKKELCAVGETVSLPGDAEPEAHEVRAVLLNGIVPDGGDKGRVVDELIGRDTYDGEILNAYVCIEVDVTSGHVRAVFYSTTTGALGYEPGTDGYLGDREYGSLLERRLGCYLAGDTVRLMEP